jgi:hypothetical protein
MRISGRRVVGSVEFEWLKSFTPLYSLSFSIASYPIDFIKFTGLNSKTEGKM